MKKKIKNMNFIKMIELSALSNLEICGMINNLMPAVNRQPRFPPEGLVEQENVNERDAI